MPRRTRKYWLLKSEPSEYSIDDLAKEGTGTWDGIRNYRARNIMRDEMAAGDLVLFYHSSCKPPGVAGVARITGEPFADPTQFDTASPYYDPKSTREQPRWIAVHVEFIERLADEVPLDVLKRDPELDGMGVRAKGNRLSVQPVEKVHFRRVLRLGNAKTRVR